MQSTWVRRVGMITLVAGLLLTSYGLGVTAAAPPVKETPQGTVTQNWDKNLPSASRFTVLTEFGGAAVRDNNTGLVWEQTADAINRPWTGVATTSASSYCASKIVGGTAGWRLPSVVELKSVQDPSLPAPFVPLSIFTGVQSAPYWSATAVGWDFYSRVARVLPHWPRGRGTYYQHESHLVCPWSHECGRVLRTRACSQVYALLCDQSLS
jgi:hypothetical protein